MDAEHHPARGDADGDRDGACREHGARERASASREDECDRREGRCGGRRMTARERSSERRSRRVECRPHAVERLLDHVDQDDLSEHHREEEDRNPAVGNADVLDDDHDGEQGDHVVGAAERRHCSEAIRRERRRVVESPLADAVVDVDERRVRPHEVREEADDQPTQGDGTEGQRQREASRRSRVETTT